MKFLVFTGKPPSKYYSGNSSSPRGNRADHELEKVLTQFDVHPSLEIGLFAAEPMLVNPTNIDIDHRGRVWVCEVVNYRGKRNSRKEGDRILILEDKNGDGKADKQTVFYQGRDIDSVHGICVLGDRVIVSAGSQVFYLIDDDQDLKADRKEVLFTGISGTQHDHGIHAFVFGPDGKLYFNFGNTGRQIKDKDGNDIVDVAGQIVSDRTFPYKQGMVFRCNLDGSEFETLGWNFRNNWEVCVDSFGRMWQSDNDDDGNRGVRINFVMQYGNFGYLDEITGAGWRSPRTGMSDEIPLRHWHLNDPGVVPNLLQTGAGSPTGICFYEGEALPKIFHQQIIHCDAGPNVVRAYTVVPDGFGFKSEMINIMDGSKYNKWFRPSDVCVAPDGSLLVADWYDPGVGGHGMGDIERGRLFRVTAKGQGGSYKFQMPDLKSVEGAIQALHSPNLATRYMAWSFLQKKGADAAPELLRMFHGKDERYAARALWLLTKTLPKDKLAKILVDSLRDNSRPLVQETALKASWQLKNNLNANNGSLFESIYVNDAFDIKNKNVLRECLIGLNFRHPNKRKPMLIPGLKKIAGQIGDDRWGLEALGIALQKSPGEKGDSAWDMNLNGVVEGLPADDARFVLWRSRSQKTPDLLGKLIADSKTSAKESIPLFRALDFQNAESVERVARKLAFQTKYSDSNKQSLVFRESLKRIRNSELTGIERELLQGYLAKDSVSSTDKLAVIRKFRLSEYADDLVKMAIQPGQRDSGRQAVEVLYELGKTKPLTDQMRSASQEQFEFLVTNIGSVARKTSAELLLAYAKSDSLPLERRRLATRKLGDFHVGCKAVIEWFKSGSHDKDLEPAMSAALHNARWNDINSQANKLFPLAKSKGDRPLPKIASLVRRRGDPEKGLLVFKKAGTCATCHVVNGEGKQVGPDMSEIGAKLSKTAMYESILFPSSAISHNYEMWRITTEEGEMIDGVLQSETADSITLLDAKGNSQTIKVEDIDEKEKQKVSLMPDDLHKLMTEQELVDLVEYLSRLKKKKK